MKKLILLAMCVAVAQNARASSAWVTVTDYQLWSNFYLGSVIRVEVSGTVENPAGCSNPDSYMVLATLPEAVKQRMYSTLLAATLAGRSVRMRVHGCETDRPAVISVVLSG